ncbi:MAG: hypothetical protein ABR567_05940 [Myxococcales bacterium]
MLPCSISSAPLFAVWTSNLSARQLGEERLRRAVDRDVDARLRRRWRRDLAQPFLLEQRRHRRRQPRVPLLFLPPASGGLRQRALADRDGFEDLPAHRVPAGEALPSHTLTGLGPSSSHGVMADLNELQRKQADTAKLAMKMAEEKDPERLKEMAEQIQARCKELEKMARGMEAALTPQEATGQEVRVTLTPDQKQRITEQTGVGIEVVTLHDTKKNMWSRDLPLGKIEPREIERLAAQQAAQSKLVSETRSQVEKIIKQLKALNVPEIADQIAELERDPTLGLGKKKR